MTSDEKVAGRGGKMKESLANPACSSPESESRWRGIAPLMSQMFFVGTG